MYSNYNFNTNYVTLDHSFLVDFYLFLKNKNLLQSFTLCGHPHHSEYVEVRGHLPRSLLSFHHVPGIKVRP